MASKTAKKKSLVLSFLGLALFSTLVACHFFLRQSKVRGASASRKTSEPVELSVLLQDHLGGRWKPYSSKQEAELLRWQPISAKIIFLVLNDSEKIRCVAAKKRARSKKKRKNSAKKHRQFEFQAEKLIDEKARLSH